MFDEILDIKLDESLKLIIEGMLETAIEFLNCETRLINLFLVNWTHGF